jgi:23S rRNA (guanosine2251-2'-O)-methyltransferase
MRNTEIVVIAHNIRSAHNVGSIFRTCDGFGASHLYLTGYTPFPLAPNDPRLPHISEKITNDIAKTALGAEHTVSFTHRESPVSIIEGHKLHGYRIVGLEQHESSIDLPSFQPPKKTVLILGEEVDGISHELLSLCDDIVEIPMRGHKESYNVSVAAGVALYALTTTISS